MRLFAAALACALLASCGVMSMRDGPGSVNVRQQVLDRTAAWAQAFDSHNPTAVAAFYAPDAVLWGTNAKEIANTREQITGYFSQSNPQTRVEFGPQNIHVYPGFVTNSGYYTFESTQNGKPVTLPARYTMVMRWVDQQWMIVEHHSSRVP